MKQSILSIAIILVSVFCLNSCGNSNTPNNSTPKITSITPDSGYIGDVILISGSNFGNIRGKSAIYFNNQPAVDYVSWNDTLINMKVPAGATTGKVMLTINSVNSNGIDFRVLKKLPSNVSVSKIQSGSFQMGSSGNYNGGMWENPVHSVQFTKSIYMGKYEVTQSLWNKVMSSNPSTHIGDNYPVENVNWLETIKFCNNLSDFDGLDKCYNIIDTNVTCNWEANGWRLPTEAEWEYSCKAGSTTDFYNGNLTYERISPLDQILDQIAWYGGNSGNISHSVGQKQQNSFGLYDMSGNVEEWVWDWFSSDYNNSTGIDPKGSSSGISHVIRGGSYYDYAKDCRSSTRYWVPVAIASTRGFRICRNY